jgi:hypothetical protein
MRNCIRQLKADAKALLKCIKIKLGFEAPQPPATDLVDEFFTYGSQYYVSARYAVLAGLMPVAGNLHHHAIEMLLKGALAKSMSSEDLQFKLGHRLRKKIWKEFKKRAANPALAKFDPVIKELDKFETIRYPDLFIKKGALVVFDVTKAGVIHRDFPNRSEPQYGLCLEEIDELVVAIFDVAGKNQKVFLNFMKPEAMQFLKQNNQHVKL